MKTINRALFLSIALVCLAAAPAQAQLVQTLNIRVTARIQLASNVVGSIQIDRIKTVRLTTTDVLRMLGTAMTNDFTGASLVTVNFGERFEVRQGTNILADVSDFFGQTPTDPVFEAKYNAATAQDNYHAFWVRTIAIDDGLGNRIELTGLTDERFTATPVDRNGFQKISDVESFSGVGTGLLGGEYAVYSGSIVLSGRAIRQP
jgi:hypothetical protein